MTPTVNTAVVGGSPMKQCLMDFRSYDSMEGIASIEPSAPPRLMELQPPSRRSASGTGKASYSRRMG